MASSTDQRHRLPPGRQAEHVARRRTPRRSPRAAGCPAAWRRRPAAALRTGCLGLGALVRCAAEQPQLVVDAPGRARPGGREEVERHPCAASAGRRREPAADRGWPVAGRSRQVHAVVDQPDLAGPSTRPQCLLAGGPDGDDVGARGSWPAAQGAGAPGGQPALDVAAVCVHDDLRTTQPSGQGEQPGARSDGDRGRQGGVDVHDVRPLAGRQTLPGVAAGCG